MPHKSLPSQNDLLRENVASILQGKELSLYEVSRSTRRIYGPSSSYLIPHNFYSALRRPAFSPSIYQLAALARVSGYRLAHWLQVFGIDLEEIPRLQLLIPSPRTQLLNSGLVDEDTEIVRILNRNGHAVPPHITALGQLIELKGRAKFKSIWQKRLPAFIYAKIGYEDTLAFPELAPGSIVRVDRDSNPHLLASPIGTTSRRIFLLEHSHGLLCCRLRRLAGDVVSVVSAQLPYVEVEFKHPREARILGVVDLEIRPLSARVEPQVPLELSRRWRPSPLEAPSTLGHLVATGRERAGLSLHAASALTRKIAEELADRRYFVSQSSLFDYELAETPPRHLEKIITLCVIYGLQFPQLLRLIGIPREMGGVEGIPAHFRSPASIPENVPNPKELRPTAGGGAFVEKLLSRVRELPVFLRGALRELSGLAAVSLEDLFWIGDEQAALHPCMSKATLAIVNRKKKRPLHFRAKLWSEQPIYLLLQRNGRYLCASCSLDGDDLVIHPHPRDLHPPFRLRNRQEAEVVGQVVTVARILD